MHVSTLHEEILHTKILVITLLGCKLVKRGFVSFTKGRHVSKKINSLSQEFAQDTPTTACRTDKSCGVAFVDEDERVVPPC